MKAQATIDYLQSLLEMEPDEIDSPEEYTILEFAQEEPEIASLFL